MTAALNTVRAIHTGSLLSSGDVLVVAGHNGAYDGYPPGLSSVERYTDHNQISPHLMGSGAVQLSYLGAPRTNCARERTFNLAPPDWIPQVTNPAGADGAFLFTNTPAANTNKFSRPLPAVAVRASRPCDCNRSAGLSPGRVYGTTGPFALLRDDAMIPPGFAAGLVSERVAKLLSAA